jgi:DNA-binding response OmpR family regulator
MPPILFVEDDPDVHLLVRAVLPEHDIHTAPSIQTALSILDDLSHDLELVLLDIHLEDGNGLDFARQFRARGFDASIIICTGKPTIETAIDAIDLDVSAYLRKPFTVDAMRAAVHNALRRVREKRKTRMLAAHMRAALALVQDDIAPANILQRGALHLNRDRYEASYNNTDLGLSPAQFRVLWMLVEHAGEPVSAGDLVQEALGYTVEDAEARSLIKSYISHLRNKLDQQAPNKTFIQTIRNAGYLWVE